MEEQYTYVFPKNFQQKFIHFLEQNNLSNLSKLLYNCKIDYTDINWAYYAGMKGSVWNKRALDFTIEAPEKTISEVKSYYSVLKAWLQNFLKPNETGFLVRYINYIIREDEINIELPENSDDDLQILNRDIAESLSRNEPVLVLDRLHTFSTRFIREICLKHGIATQQANGDFYPLHSLVGMLTKYYRNNNLFESEFIEQAFKMSISLFEKYNSVRNDQSYAHDNKVLNNKESAYIVRVMAATLNLLDEIENS